MKLSVGLGMSVLTLAGCSDEKRNGLSHLFSESEARLLVTPTDAMFDHPIQIKVTGLRASERVQLTLRSSNDVGPYFISTAEFESDANGIVDLTAMKPLSGSYDWIDSMGLFWSSELKFPPVQPGAGSGSTGMPNFKVNPFQSMNYRLQLERNNIKVNEVLIVRRRKLDETVHLEEVKSGGVVGNFFYRKEGGKRPTVLLLGGSDGNAWNDMAALLVSKGYSVFAAQYFKGDGLPAELAQVPVENMEKVIEYLKSRHEVDVRRLGILGGSKGAELALLLASKFPGTFKAVVGYVPSGVIWQGITQGSQPTPISSWAYQGKDLPFQMMRFDLVDFGKPTWALRPIYEGSLSSLSADAIIPVEKIEAPIALISGTDDQVWPSSTLCQMIVKRLKDKGYVKEVMHLDYADAGHVISIPYFPSTFKSFGPMLVGGNTFANAKASADSWNKVSEFLKRNL